MRFSVKKELDTEIESVSRAARFGGMVTLVTELAAHAQSGKVSK
jgi:hypothetical protein